MHSHEPVPWGPITENTVIRQFYREEFPTYTSEIPDWITPPGPKQYAIALTERYPIKAGSSSSRGSNGPERDFIRRSTKGKTETYLGTWEDVISFFAHPAANDPLQNNSDGDTALLPPESNTDIDSTSECPAAEAVYYQLQHHDRFWVLAFDIDAKDVAVKRVSHLDDPRRTRDICEEAGVTEQPPEGYPYTFDDIDQALVLAFELRKLLQERLEFTETMVLYSGQGAHIYGLDTDPFHRYTERTRKTLGPMIREKFGIPIDQQVTTDEKRVMRVPYSLHTDVGRLVVPIDTPDFDFRQASIPQILTSDAEVTTND